MDSVLITESLIKSYTAFKLNKKDYPFVEMRHLKPRAKIVGPEYPEQGHFIVIFNEDTLPPEAKTHIRFFESNRVTKENLGLFGVFDLQDVFHQRMRYFEDTQFVELLKKLLKADFALLIQRDPHHQSQVQIWAHAFSCAHRLAGSDSGRGSGTLVEVYLQGPL